ncbi:Rho GTPase activation protein [Piromyces finnis]|uniref:Rho GTPase activation protein n=1 Tax=Piromyces finnis TaxID=1754191 RepID=A0A1Y1V686_9FUNG|nr:Rho GTPase activation protein [Piromyces finnis]|eukprot:ORX48181.1 Rho GTPase activation protein [Piromyces finnis]
MGKKNKIFGNTLDYLVKRAEDELKKTNINLDSSTKSLKKKPITSRYVVKHIPPEIQEFVQFFTKNEVWNVEGIFRKNSSVKDLKKAKKIIEDEGSLNLDKYDKGDSILVSGLFKNFLAEIQGRIIPYKIYIKLKEAKTDADLKEVLKELPINNYETLNYINQFVLKINDHCETNYMNLSNLSIVIGPNLFELTNDEMVNLNITVISSDIYKNILRIRKTERDNAEVHINIIVLIYFNNYKKYI